MQWAVQWQCGRRDGRVSSSKKKANENLIENSEQREIELQPNRPERSRIA
jgi:hypothetical protein